MFNDRLQKITSLLSKKDKDSELPAKQEIEQEQPIKPENVSAENISSTPSETSVSTPVETPVVTPAEPVVTFFEKNVINDTKKTISPPEHHVDIDSINDFKRRAQEAMRKKIKNDALTIDISPDRLSATLRISSKFDKSEPFTIIELWERIKQSRVDFGISEDLVFELSVKPIYDTDLIFAIGTPAVDGTDGNFTPHFDYSEIGKFKSHEIDFDAKIDFKNLVTNNICSIADQVLGVITTPVDAVDGTDVYGNIIRARQSKPTKVTFGENVFINEENQVVATCAGDIKWNNTHLSVSEIFQVLNVDAKTGNINFGGSVVVEGDVLDGFSITCGGDIHVKGQVSSANLTAGGNITIDKGVHARRTSSCLIKARGNVSSKFIEQATIDCYGDLITGELIHSQTLVRGDVKALAGMGKIIGGECTCCGNISAATVGNYANVLTKLSLIGRSSLDREHEQLKDEIKVITLRISKMWENSKIQIFRTRNHVYKDAIAEKTKIDVQKLEEELAIKVEFFERLSALVARHQHYGEIIIIRETYENVRFRIMGTDFITNFPIKRSRFILNKSYEEDVEDTIDHIYIK